MLTACTKKPWDYDDVIWFSENPEIEIIKKSGEDWIGYVMVGETKIEVELAWGPTLSFDIIDASTDVPISNDTALLRGKVKYNKDTVTLVIKTDNLFSNQYENIVLSRRNV